MKLTIQVRDLPLSLDEALHPEEALRRSVAKRLRLPAKAFGPLRVVRRALDARRQHPRFIYSVELQIDAPQGERLVRQGKAFLPAPLALERLGFAKLPDGPPPVVVGAGPAGLLAAWILAEAGWPPLIIERGRSVEERGRDVSQLYAHGVLDPESNVCYGEGGAGTFSDGKLYTRVNDPRVTRLLELLVSLGADPDILIDNRPHLGTDRLVVLLRNMRARLIELGATFRFATRVDGITLRDGALAGFSLAGGEHIEASQAVLATGHSAREVWHWLGDAGLPLESRPIAVGFRVEHPQALINEIRYGRFAGHRALPAADYRLAFNQPSGEKRGVYSFCMCPGGVVVATPTLPEELCVNGMSHAARDGRYANSALVVTVGPEDFAAAGYRGVMAGVAFQQQVEAAAFRAGGGDFAAPAARITDFLAGRLSQELPKSSYRRGLAAADLSSLYPAPVIVALTQALEKFEEKQRGFVSEEAVLIGVETRTASPIRLPRGEDLQATGARGLYPAGEGMGYGGGIVSAAVDGMRAAAKLLAESGATPR